MESTCVPETNGGRIVDELRVSRSMHGVIEQEMEGGVRWGSWCCGPGVCGGCLL